MEYMILSLRQFVLQFMYPYEYGPIFEEIL